MTARWCPARPLRPRHRQVSACRTRAGARQTYAARHRAGTFDQSRWPSPPRRLRSLVVRRLPCPHRPLGRRVWRRDAHRVPSGGRRAIGGRARGRRDASDWAPIVPPPAAVQPPLSFVDGVRRMEARLVVTATAAPSTGPSARSASASSNVATGGQLRRGTARARRRLRGRARCRPAAGTRTRPGLRATQRRRGRRRCAAARESMPRCATPSDSWHATTPPPTHRHRRRPAHPRRPRAGTSWASSSGCSSSTCRASSCPCCARCRSAARTPVFLIAGGGRFSRYSWFLAIGPRLPSSPSSPGSSGSKSATRSGRDDGGRPGGFDQRRAAALRALAQPRPARAAEPGAHRRARTAPPPRPRRRPPDPSPAGHPAGPGVVHA